MWRTSYNKQGSQKYTAVQKGVVIGTTGCQVVLAVVVGTDVSTVACDCLSVQNYYEGTMVLYTRPGNVACSGG